MKKKILFILPWLPYPLKSGGHQAIMNAMSALKNDFEVYVVFETIDDELYAKDKVDFLTIMPHAHLLPLFREKLSPFPLWYRCASKIKTYLTQFIKHKGKHDKARQICEDDICHGWISSVSPLKKQWLEHIAMICSEYSFDIIQVEMPWLLSQVLTLPDSAIRVYVHHELGFVRRELEQDQFENNVYVKACKNFADAMEIALLNKYDGVITLSPIDKQKLESNGVSVPVFASFAKVDISEDPLPDEIDGRHLSFVGSDNHMPNLVGIKWFLEHCWQMLQSEDNGYRLSIIGKWSEQHMEELTSKYSNIHFHGFVENLGACIRGTVMIVPITIGSGIRMKILDACSLGIPFVSTSVGAEGIPVESGINCFIADNPEQFVADLLKLRAASLQNKFVNQAYSMLVNHYSTDALRKNRLEIYNQLHQIKPKTVYASGEQ